MEEAPCTTRRNPRSLVAVTAVFLAALSPASAVQLSQEGRGSALVLPIVNTESGMASLVTVGGGSAVKIHVRADDETLLKTLNVYPAGTWVASITGEGTAATLTSPDDCVLVNDQGTTVVADGGVELDASYGYLEIIQMGVIADMAVSDAVESGDCQALADRWNEGAWSTMPNEGLSAPADELRATVSLIGIERGTLFSLRAAALAGFSDIPQHAPPASEVPNLSTPHDGGTDTGQTMSRVCYQGTCYEDTWAVPRDAVAAALMTQELWGDFVVDPAIDAATTWLVVYPMNPYFLEESVLHQTTELELAVWDRDGQLTGDIVCIGTPPPPPQDFENCESSYFFEHTSTLGVIALNRRIQADDAPASSRMLGLTATSPVPPYGPDFPEAGEARIGFETNRQPLLTSNGGRGYLGRPALGFAFEEYVNGFLVDDAGGRIRANYGNVFELSRKGAVKE